MSEINRMLRQLDTSETPGELTLEMQPAPSPSPAHQTRDAGPDQRAPQSASPAVSAALEARAAATAAASRAAELAAEPTGSGAPVSNKSDGAAKRWRLPALVLAGASAIAAAVWVGEPTTPAEPAINAVAATDTAAGEKAAGETALASAPAATQAADAPVPSPPAVASVASVAAVSNAVPAQSSGTTGPGLSDTPSALAAPPAPSVQSLKPPPPNLPAPTRAAAGPSAKPSTGTVAALPDSALASLAAVPPLATPFSTAARIDKRNLAPTAEQRAKALMHNATELARTGQRQAALGRAREALVADPQHVPARQLAAVLLYESGDSSASLALLREGVALEGSPPALALLLARLLAHQNLGPEALTVLDQHSLNNADAEGLRASLLSQQGLYGRALLAFENALRQQPGNATWWVGLAVALESEGQSARARQAYAHARQLGLAQADLASYVDQRLRALD